MDHVRGSTRNLQLLSELLVTPVATKVGSHTAREFASTLGPRDLEDFKTLAMIDVPRSRNGKHKQIVTAILRDLDQLGIGAAFKVPLADLGDSKENVRSALNRATRKAGRDVATATDDKFLYVWNVTKPA